MAINLINIGNIANDGTGDDLREAFVKVNNNFEELDLRDNEKTTVCGKRSGGVEAGAWHPPFQISDEFFVVTQ